MGSCEVEPHEGVVMSQPSDDRPTREMRPTQMQSLLRGPHAVNLEVELEVIDAAIASGTDHALPAPRRRIAMRALTARALRYPDAPGGPPIAVRVLAIIVALLAAYVVALLF